jgi:hypothetical protein
MQPCVPPVSGRDADGDEDLQIGVDQSGPPVIGSGFVRPLKRIRNACLVRKSRLSPHEEGPTASADYDGVQLKRLAVCLAHQDSCVLSISIGAARKRSRHITTVKSQPCQ